MQTGVNGYENGCRASRLDIADETATMAVTHNFRTMAMLTMTAVAAQNQVGNLIDSSQRQPVTVTRRGRPVAVVLSYEDYIQKKKTIPYEVFKFISENFPLRGKEAGDSMRAALASMGNLAEKEGLTEEDVMRMLNEE